MPRKILIVDDIAMNRHLLKGLLCKDYDILEAENGKEAFALMNRYYKMLSAVLLDIVMPEMDGYEVLRRARDNVLLSQIPIIIVTGSEDEDSRVKALSLGANDFILKPYNPEIIKHCLRNNIALRETASILNAIQKDKLTGLYNREAFFEKVKALIKEKEPGYYLLACFDIDNFKLINDQFGAVEGDRILRLIGVAIKEDMDAANGIAGRISADNFAVLYPAAKQIIDPLQRLKSRNMVLLEQQAVAISVGRYVVTDLTLPASAIYDRAYIAKQSVKGRYDKHLAYFDELMLERLVMNQQITGEMEAALQEQQFEVWFQPQYNHEAGQLIGAEALVRWRHPQKGIIAPGDFIPIFEQTGFIYELDKYMWRMVCRYLRRWLDEGRQPLPVSVNVSRYDIFRADLIEVIVGIIKEYRIAPELLRLEITESAFATSTEVIVRIVKQLIDLGFTIEIDDFGSGYSSLNTLKDVPAQVVKLDMRFLEGEDASKRGGNILESIVRMTKWLGMTVLAEGVEEKNQADFLKSIGCTYVQGYLYSRPIPAAAYEALCGGAGIEELPFELETVDGLNYNDFWDPNSLDTLIFNNYSGGACVYEYCNGNIELLRVSDQYVRLVFGEEMSISKLLGIDWTKHATQQTLDALKMAMEESIRTKKEVIGEYLFLDLPGCPPQTYLRSALRAIASAGDRHVVYCVSENITAQREAEQQQLEREQKRLAVAAELRKNILDNIAAGIATYEGEPDAPSYNMRLIYFNEGFCRLFGYTRDEYAELAAANPAGLVYEEDWPQLQEQIGDLFRNNKPLNCIYRSHTKGDGYKWLNLKAVVLERHGAKVTANAVFIDITSSQEALERLRVSEEENRLAMRLSGNMVSRYTVADRSLLTSTESAAIFGRPEKLEDVPYEPVRQGLVAPESVQDYIGFYEGIIRGSEHGSAVFHSKTSAGWRWLEGRYLTIFASTGEPVSAVISFNDVTEQLEKEAVYQKWQQSLQGKKQENYSLFRCNISKNTSYDSVEGLLLAQNFHSDNFSFDGRVLEYGAQCVCDADREKFVAFLHSDAMLARYNRGKRSAKLEYREKLPEEKWRWLRLSVDLFEYHNSTDVEALLLFENIDEEKRAELQTKTLAETDPLTGVFNRAAFIAKIEQKLQNRQPNSKHALLMLDIDGFKLVNDVFGHAVGDRTLIDIANALQSVMRRDDLIGRLGGDEFLLFMSDIPQAAVAATRARQICALTGKAFSLEVQISGSIGIAIAPDDGADFETLYKKADAALYYVKGSGKNNFAFYHDQAQDRKSDAQNQAANSKNVKEKKPRMLIVEDSKIDLEVLASIFKEEFVLEKARDGNAALIALRHFGSAIAVVLLDLFMPGMDGFAVLEKMQGNPELQSIPVIVVSGDEQRATCLKAIKSGATDFVTKPVDAEVLRLRVQAAISKSAIERLRARSSYRELQSDETIRYRTVLERTGTVVLEYDWVSSKFTYDPAIVKYIAGTYDERKLWRILLSDMVADALTVQKMQELIHSLAGDRSHQEAEMQVQLKTPTGAKHWFRLTVYKLPNEFGLTDKLILTFNDLGLTLKGAAN